VVVTGACLPVEEGQTASTSRGTRKDATDEPVIGPTSRPVRFP
jgi:hypothetical protein